MAGAHSYHHMWTLITNANRVRSWFSSLQDAVYQSGLNDIPFTQKEKRKRGSIWYPPPGFNSLNS